MILSLAIIFSLLMLAAAYWEWRLLRKARQQKLQVDASVLPPPLIPPSFFEQQAFPLSKTAIKGGPQLLTTALQENSRAVSELSFFSRQR